MATAAIDLPGKRSGATPIFVTAIFIGSFLLFLMQPMVARLALPQLGGTPAVWNSAMLVYQALLLAGYGYAHLLGRLPIRSQGLVHLLLLTIAATWLPIGISGQAMPAGTSPVIWVPWLLLISIGPIFFALSAQAPLLQRWFSASSPGNPYLLYIASNLGSFGGLLAYPLLAEPLLPLAGQRHLWSAAFAILCIGLAVIAYRLPARQTAALPKASEGPRPTLWLRLQWVALAAVPSGLIMATTTHLTTDIIAMPLIWVVPLGLYLLSFTLAFSDEGRIARAIGWSFPLILIIAGAMAGSGQNFSLWAGIAADLALLFGTAVTLHHRMYRLRPDPAHLTEFYLYMSLGGVIGGAFCALLAPILFDWGYEYPLLVVAAALLMPLRPGVKPLSPRQRRWIALSALIASLYAGGLLGIEPPLALKAMALVGIAVLVRMALAHRILFATCIAALLLGLGCWMSIWLSIDGTTRVRSYFGIYTVGRSAETHVLTHGTTTHGVQLWAPALQTRPTAYYAPLSGIGLAMRGVPSLYGDHARIGVVGLGAGTLACYAHHGQTWRFYEIDPAMAAIARDPAKFRFLGRCLPDADIRIGDARLTIAEERPASRDLLAIDAFSSDSIPTHLLTREAIDRYARLLQPNGLLLFHISNRYVDLKPVLAAAAIERGWRVVIRNYQPDEQDVKLGATRSLWIAMSPSSATMDALLRMSGADAWQPLPARPGFTAWTDDYASILPLLHKP